MKNKTATHQFTFFFSFAVLALSGCSGLQVAVNEKADFTQIHRVAVAAFSGPGGEAAADMFAQDLLARGADVVERQRLDAITNENKLGSAGLLDPTTLKKVGKILGVDAIFVGTVIDNTPSQNYLINAGGPGSINLNTVTPVSGSTLYARGPAIGIPGSEVITSAANVAMIARLVDVETGSILWSARTTYEGLDTSFAMSNITTSFANSLTPLWPALHPTR